MFFVLSPRFTSKWYRLRILAFTLGIRLLLMEITEVFPGYSSGFLGPSSNNGIPFYGLCGIALTLDISTIHKSDQHYKYTLQVHTTSTHYMYTL